MIADVDLSLAAFLGKALEGVTICFDTPSDEWASGVQRPALSCFLHLILEDTSRRLADSVDVRGADGLVGARQPPVRHYQLHYQLSAWSASAADEHRLLGQVLEACAGDDAVPDDCLQGVLKGEVEPVLVRSAMELNVPAPPPHDVWSSLSLPLRASVALRVIAPLRPQLRTDVAPPAEALTLGMESIQPPPSDSRHSAAIGNRAWTTFRIRERSALTGPADDVAQQPTPKPTRRRGA